MKHRGDVVKADQRRFAGRRLRQVRDVVDDRQGAQQRRLIDELRHPSTAVLVVALEIIAIEQRQRLAIRVGDFENPHIGFVHGNVLAFLEGDAVQLIGRKEHARLEYGIEFEVGLDFGFVEVEFGLAYLLVVESPIPGCQGESAMLRVDYRLNVLGFAQRRGASPPAPAQT